MSHGIGTAMEMHPDRNESMERECQTTADDHKMEGLCGAGATRNVTIIDLATN